MTRSRSRTRDQGAGAESAGDQPGAGAVARAAPESGIDFADRLVASGSTTGVGRVGRRLESDTLVSMEHRFGADLSTVVIHDDERAAETARLLGARAYTIGEHISFASRTYEPSTTSGRSLLAHELAHVIQQRGGGSPPGPRHEREAAVAARYAVDGDVPPIAVQQSSAVDLACSVDDWLVSSPDLAALSFSQLVKDSDEIRQWLARQTTSTPESVRLEEALSLLAAEQEGRARKRQRSTKQARRRRSGRRARSAEATDASTAKPRILVERTSVQYESTGEVDGQIDLIMAWLERGDVSPADRSLLESELEHLAPQFEQGRRQESGERARARLARALRPVPGDEGAELAQVSGVLRRLVTDPARPGDFLIFHEGEQLTITGQQVEQLRREIARHFRRGINRIRAKITSGFGYYHTQAEINRDSPIISTIAGILGDAGDPIMAMEIRRATAESFLAAVDAQVLEGSNEAAARNLAQAEQLAILIEKAGRAFNESHIRGGELAVTGLELTRDVSFAISGSIAAIVAAPVVAAGVAGAGLTGAAGVAATTVGTGLVVGTGTAVVRGGSAGTGELVAGNSLEAAAAATKREGKRGFVEGAATGVSGGFAHSAGAALGVAREGAKLTTKIAVEASADVIGGTTAGLLEGKDLGDSLVGGLTTAAFGVPGSIGGNVVRGRAAKAATDMGLSATTAAGGTLAAGGSTEDALLAGSIAAASGGLIRRAKPAGGAAPQRLSESRNAENPAVLTRRSWPSPSRQSHTDPFTGQTGKVAARSGGGRSQRTSIDADLAEAEDYKGLLRAGEVGLARTNGANRRGPDSITFDPASETIYLNDSQTYWTDVPATQKPTSASSRWLAEARQAAEHVDIDDPALERKIREAAAAGRIERRNHTPRKIAPPPPSTVADPVDFSDVDF